MNERDIFLAALDIENDDARTAFLLEQCGDNAELLSRVRGLLSSHESQSQFLNRPAVEQIAENAEAAGAQTQQMSNGATADEQPEDAPNSDATFISDHSESDDEIPLGYLSPSDREDSLGRLKHYEILEVIGRGAFGIVLKAFDENLKRVVAIKVLSPEMAVTSPARKRFKREAESSAKVRHENVVSIYAVEVDPIPYLVMEYIPGETLQERLDGTGPLEILDVLRLGKQMADGLAAAHAQGLIHRDIKPGNILLETSINDHVKITDFGLARAADDASMTRSGVIAGTPMYMAPEQALGHKLDQRADLFSLGSVLYQMVSGRLPFRAPSTVAVLKRVAEETPRPIQEIIPETPDWMCHLIGHLHAKDPDDRFQTAQEVSELLGRCLDDVQNGRTPEIAPPKDFEPELARLTSERRLSGRVFSKPLTQVAAVLILLLVGLGLTEATGVTKLTNTVIRLATGSGTLVITSKDPDIEIAIEGQEITIQGGGVSKITLSPGEYKVTAGKEGKVIQELVTITRNGETALSISLAPSVDTQITEIRTELKRLNPRFQTNTLKYMEEEGAVVQLSFVSDYVTDISPLRKLTSLRTLNISGTYDQYEAKKFGASRLKDIRPLQGLPLEVLEISGTEVDDLTPLKGMPLKRFGASCTNVKDLSPLSVARLESLSLDGTPIDNASLAHLEGCTSLKLVDLRHTKVADAGLAHLQNSQGMTHLFLNRIMMTDAGLAHFRDFKNLQLLQIGWTQVTNDGLAKLPRQNLENVMLSETQVTDLSLLADSPLKVLYWDFVPERDTDILRSKKTLESINRMSTAEFWKDVEKTISLSPADAPTPDNYALSFDGEDDYVETPKLLDEPKSPLTLEAYLTHDNDAKNGVVVGTHAGLGARNLAVGSNWQVFAHSISPDGVMFRIEGSRGTDRGLRRTHVAAVWDDNDRPRIFVDGYETQTNSQNQPRQGEEKDKPFDGIFTIGTGPIDFWSKGDLPLLFYQGIIDEVRISNAARYSKDFTPVNRFESDKHTLALYHFDEGTGEVLKDSSGNGHDARIFGARWVDSDGAEKPVGRSQFIQAISQSTSGESNLKRIADNSKIAGVEVEFVGEFGSGSLEPNPYWSYGANLRLKATPELAGRYLLQLKQTVEVTARNQHAKLTDSALGENDGQTTGFEVWYEDGDMIGHAIASLARSRASEGSDSNSWEILLTVTEWSKESRPLAIPTDFPVLKRVYDADVVGSNGKLAISPDGKLLATLGDALRIWDVENGTQLKTFELSSVISAVFLKHDPHLIAMGIPDISLADDVPGKLLIWNYQNEALVRELPIKAGEIHALDVSPDGRWLAIGAHINDTGQALLWDLESFETRVLVDNEPVNQVAFSPDGKYLITATANERGTLRLFDTATSEQVAQQKDLLSIRKVIKALAVSPDSKHLAVAGGNWRENDGRILLLDLPDLTIQNRVVRGETEVRAVTFSPDGKMLATGGGSGNGEVCLLDGETLNERTRFTAYSSRAGVFNQIVSALAISSDGRSLFTAADHESARLWQLPENMWPTKASSTR